MIRPRRLGAAAAGLAIVARAASQTLPATQPAAAPPVARATTAAASPTTSRPATTQAAAEVSFAAQRLLDRLAAASAGALSVSGTITGDFDVAGRRKIYRLDIVGRCDDSGRFWHYGTSKSATGAGVDGGGLLVSDGTHGYLYDEPKNIYAELQVAPGRAEADALDPAISDILLDENPALLLHLTSDPAALLCRLAKSIRVPPGDKISALVLDLGGKTVTLEFDPRTLAIVRSTIDYLPVLAAHGAAGVTKSAKAVLIYGPAPVLGGGFAWSPPATASEITLRSELIRSAIRKVPATQP